MKIHNLVVMVGPSNCGKSVLSKELKASAEKAGIRATIISSDSIRQYLLNSEQSKMSSEMLEISGQAFMLLEAQIQAHLSHPVCTELVIVDSTGLNEHFRQRMADIADRYGYNKTLVVFNPSKEDLLENIRKSKELFGDTSEADEGLSLRHLTRVREAVLGGIDRKIWKDVVKIQKPHQLEKLIEDSRQENFFEDKELQNATTLYVSKDQPVAVIGDVHECTDALKRLVQKVPPEAILVFVGDIIDRKVSKEKQIETDGLENTLNYLQELQSTRKVIIVNGNHENFVFGRIAGKFSAMPELEETYFTSVAELKENPQLLEKAKSVFANNVPFLKIQDENRKNPQRRTAFITHAPCKEIYLGKFSEEALKAQRNFYFKERGNDDKKREELKFIYEEATKSGPWHIFGHVSVRGGKVVRDKNKVWLDTGAASGGALSAAILIGEECYFAQSPTSEDYEYAEKDFFEVFKKLNKGSLEYVTEQYFELDENDQAAVDSVLRGRAEFISGTMPPAPSKGNDLESLEAGLEMFKKQGCSELILEPKYMGSRCQAYLNKKEPSKSFFVSRSGFEFKHVEGLDQLVEKLLEKFKDYPFESELILDGELLPWHALGSGLINRDFHGYADAIDYQLSGLAHDEAFKELKVSEKVNIAQKQQCLEVFKEQLEIYGQEGELVYQPFGILRVDGKVLIEDNSVFMQIAQDEHLVINVQEEGFLEKAQEFVSKLVTERKMEGVVIKPLKYDSSKNQIPYMKVRNKNYLTLIYGYDYKLKEEKLARQKNISGKLSTAINEFKLGKLMLENPEHRTKFVCALYGEIAKERSLDPRL